ncbi:MAG TPA: TetR/AcrR family transcriptional regulator [Gaiellales bacterium]|nr:TetR/AcrR family transcriptional regulator [Gaiellales bacterium]
MTRDRHDGTKRGEILAAATRRFGRDGYEHTKWADVAADVGVGPTALYHYFESKQHCLYVIMEEAIEDFERRFSAITSATPDPIDALAAVLHDCFDLTEQDVMRNRVLVSEQGLLGVRRSSSREEDARRDARAKARQLEFAWASFLAGAMRAGAVPESEPRLLSRALLGLYNSVWQWYRPDGIHGLRSIADFFHGRALAMIGVAPEGITRTRMVA